MRIRIPKTNTSSCGIVAMTPAMMFMKIEKKKAGVAHIYQHPQRSECSEENPAQKNKLKPKQKKNENKTK